MSAGRSGRRKKTTGIIAAATAATIKHRRPPAGPCDRRREDRQEDQLPGGEARGEHAHDQAAARGKPAGRHGCGEDHGGAPAADADEHAPGENELPLLRDEGAERHGGAEEDEREDDDAANAEALHGSGREGADEAEDEDVDPDGERDAGARPAELFLERNDQDARGGANAGPGYEDQEDEGRSDPGKMNTAAEEAEISANIGRFDDGGGRLFGRRRHGNSHCGEGAADAASGRAGRIARQ